MCKATVKNQPSGDISISLNMMLQDEPLALYVDPQAGAISLKFCSGQLLALKHNSDCAFLAQQEEVTIESFVGGLLAAGYRIGIRSAAH